VSDHDETVTVDGAEVGVDLEAVLMADPRDRAELLSALLEAEAQRDGLLDDLLRARADFENYRKRVARDTALQREHGRIDVAQALLEALDDLDRAEDVIAGLDAAGDETGLAHGVTLVAGRLRRALAGVGLERVDAVGVAFDPNVHEAVQHVERPTGAADTSTGPPSGAAEGEQRVAQVLRPGYRMGERVLRAAMVVVEG
jgi:molecular chaperone GrpE